MAEQREVGVPPRVIPATPPAPAPDLNERFQELARRWKAETLVTSSVGEMTGHPAYREIVRMGPPAVPLLLAELEREPHHWFAALKEITGENPVPPEGRGNLDKMTAAWLAWGAARGHRS